MLYSFVTVSGTTCISSTELMIQRQSTTFLYFLCITFHYKFLICLEAVLLLCFSENILSFCFCHTDIYAMAHTCPAFTKLSLNNEM